MKTSISLHFVIICHVIQKLKIDKKKNKNCGFQSRIIGTPKIYKYSLDKYKYKNMRIMVRIYIYVYMLTGKRNIYCFIFNPFGNFHHLHHHYRERQGRVK